jgi:hypothetical protein
MHRCARIALIARIIMALIGLTWILGAAGFAPSGWSRAPLARGSDARSTPLMSDRQQRHKVVVTGVGAVTSVGHNIDEMMVNLLAGKSGIDTVTSFDPKPFQCQIGSEVKGFDFTKYMDPKARAHLAESARARRTGGSAAARASPPPPQS